jgi:hypothetical protein
LKNLGNLIKSNIKYNNLDNSLASGIKSKNKNIKITNRKKLVKNISKVSFKKISKSKTRKFKKLFLLSAKLKNKNKNKI